MRKFFVLCYTGEKLLLILQINCWEIMCKLCKCKHHAIICAQCLDGYRQVKELMMELEAEAPLKGENDLVAESFQ